MTVVTNRGFALPPDELDRTARQVRIPGGLTHRLALARTDRSHGRTYLTDCDKTLWASSGAVLTTDDVDCVGCGKTAVKP